MKEVHTPIGYSIWPYRRLFSNQLQFTLETLVWHQGETETQRVISEGFHLVIVILLGAGHASSSKNRSVVIRKVHKSYRIILRLYLLNSNSIVLIIIWEKRWCRI